MHTMRFASVVLIIALALSACGQAPSPAPSASPAPSPTSRPALSSTPLPPPPSPTPAPTATPPPVTSLFVAAQRPAEIRGVYLLSLSPNGQQLLAIRNPRTLCIYSAESLVQQQCVELASGVFDWRSITWSPDNKRIAFTEDVFHSMFESDVWVLDVSTGRLTNLTDDGASGSLVKLRSEKSSATVDLIPAWTHDGKSLVFARTPLDSDETALYRVSSTGGEPKRLWTVADQAMAVFYFIRCLDDGRIVYTLGHNKLPDSDNGIWIVGPGDDKPRQLAGALDKKMGYPILLDVAAGQDRALVWYYAASQHYASLPNMSMYALLDLKTGALEPLKKAAGDAPEFSGPSNAVFSPDGSRLLYVYRDLSKDEHRLVVRDAAGGDEQVLFSGSVGWSDIGLGLHWASNGTIYIAKDKTSGAILGLSWR